jgi:hypothetical protein
MSVKTQFLATHQQSDGDALLPYLKEYDYGVADLVSDKYTIPVPAGSLILGVTHVVTQVWNGTTPVVDVGDGTDADAFIAAASTATLNAVASSLAGAAANAGGYYFPASGKIVLTHTTAATTGASKVLVQYAY